MGKISKRINYIMSLPDVLRNKIIIWCLLGVGMMVLAVIIGFAGMLYEVYAPILILAAVCVWLGYKIYYLTTREQCYMREGTVVNFDYALHLPRFSFKKGVYRTVKAVLICEDGGRLIKVSQIMKEKLEKGMRIKIYVSRKADESAYVSNGVRILSNIIAYELTGIEEVK